MPSLRKGLQGIVDDLSLGSSPSITQGFDPKTIQHIRKEKNIFSWFCYALVEDIVSLLSRIDSGQIIAFKINAFLAMDYFFEQNTKSFVIQFNPINGKDDYNQEVGGYLCDLGTLLTKTTPCLSEQILNGRHGEEAFSKAMGFMTQYYTPGDDGLFVPTTDPTFQNLADLNRQGILTAAEANALYLYTQNAICPESGLKVYDEVNRILRGDFSPLTRFCQVDDASCLQRFIDDQAEHTDPYVHDISEDAYYQDHLEMVGKLTLLLYIGIFSGFAIRKIHQFEQSAACQAPHRSKHRGEGITLYRAMGQLLSNRDEILAQFRVGNYIRQNQLLSCTPGEVWKYTRRIPEVVLKINCNAQTSIYATTSKYSSCPGENEISLAPSQVLYIMAVAKRRISDGGYQKDVLFVYGEIVTSEVLCQIQLQKFERALYSELFYRNLLVAKIRADQRSAQYINRMILSTLEAFSDRASAAAGMPSGRTRDGMRIYSQMQKTNPNENLCVFISIIIQNILNHSMDSLSPMFGEDGQSDLFYSNIYRHKEKFKKIYRLIRASIVKNLDTIKVNFCFGGGVGHCLMDLQDYQQGISYERIDINSKSRATGIANLAKNDCFIDPAAHHLAATPEAQLTPPASPHHHPAPHHLAATPEAQLTPPAFPHHHPAPQQTPLLSSSGQNASSLDQIVRPNFQQNIIQLSGYIHMQAIYTMLNSLAKFLVKFSKHNYDSALATLYYSPSSAGGCCSADRFKFNQFDLGAPKLTEQTALKEKIQPIYSHLRNLIYAADHERGKKDGCFSSKHTDRHEEIRRLSLDVTTTISKLIPGHNTVVTEPFS